MEKQRVIELYLDYLDEAPKAPNWVYKFTDAAEITGEIFYQYFEDIDQLEQHLWLIQWDNTREILARDPAYSTYSVREKLLALYFTLIEVLNERPVAFSKMLNRWFVPGTTPGSLRPFQKLFKEQVQQLVQEGIGNGEIEPRPLIGSYYADVLWLQCLLLLRVWKNDRSANQQITDEAVERIVNLVADLMAYNPVDATIGLGRFIYRNQKLLK